MKTLKLENIKTKYLMQIQPLLMCFYVFQPAADPPLAEKLYCFYVLMISVRIQWCGFHGWLLLLFRRDI